MSDYTVGDTCYFMFTTRQVSGAPFTLAGSPVISAYEDAGTTQITAGVSLGVDHDSVTGLNLVTVVASGANGFEAGKDYHLVITTGTVNSVSVVGEVIGRFTLQRSAAAVDLANGTDGLGAIKTDTAAILVDTGTTLDARLPAALTADGNIKADALRVGGTVQTAGDIVSMLTTIDDFLDTEIAAILADTGTDIPALIAALNNLSAAQVNAEVVDALATDTYAEPTGTPAATIALTAKVGWMYMALRNKLEVTETAKTFYDDGGAAEWKKTLSDDGTTYGETEATAP